MRESVFPASGDSAGRQEARLGRANYRHSLQALPGGDRFRGPDPALRPRDHDRPDRVIGMIPDWVIGTYQTT